MPQPKSEVAPKGIKTEKVESTYMLQDDRELTIMEFLNEVAVQSYESRSERFKSLISKENPYLALFTALIKMPRKVAKQNSSNLC